MPGPRDPKRHIVFSGRTEPSAYISPQFGSNPLRVAERNRSEHGNFIKERIEAIRDQSRENENSPLPPGAIREDGVYVEFTSDFNFQLAFDSFEDGRSGHYHLLRCTREGDQFRVADVTLTVTLSYFIEPNPGSRFLSSKFSYQSHGLRFKIKRPLESDEEFRIRINRAARDEEGEYESSSDSDAWLLGERTRNIGSIQKDVWIGTGAQLASMNRIAVHPVNGWWRFRTRLLRYQQRGYRPSTTRVASYL